MATEYAVLSAAEDEHYSHFPTSLTAALSFEPDLNCVSKQWTMLTAYPFSIDQLSCNHLNYCQDGLLSLHLGCKNSFDNCVERALIRHLIQPSGWNDELPHVQSTIGQAMKVWHLAATQPLKCKVLSVSNNVLGWNLCLYIASSYTDSSENTSNVKANLNSAQDQIICLKQLVRQAKRTMKMYASFRNLIQAPPDIGLIDNLFKWKALKAEEERIRESEKEASQNQDDHIQKEKWLQTQLNGTCDQNENALKLLCSSLHLQVVDMQRTLSLCLFQQQKKQHWFKGTLNLEQKMTNGKDVLETSESNKEKESSVQKDCIQKIRQSANEFIRNLRQLVYVDHCNPLTVEELVYGRILPYLWRECNHRRRELRVQLSLDAGEETRKHALQLAFANVHRLLMNVAAIYIVISVDYLCMMEPAKLIYLHVQQLVDKLEEYLQKAFVYADALVQRDRLMNRFRRRKGARSLASVTELQLMLESDLPIVSELHAQLVLAYCIKMHHDHLIGCAAYEMPMLQAPRFVCDNLKNQSATNLNQSITSQALTNFFGKTKQKNSVKRNIVKFLRLLFQVTSPQSKFTKISTVYLSSPQNLRLDHPLKVDGGNDKDLVTSLSSLRANNRNLLTYKLINRYINQLNDHQLLSALVKSLVQLQQLLLFSSCRTSNAPVLFLGGWSMPIGGSERKEINNDTKIDESKIVTNSKEISLQTGQPATPTTRDTVFSANSNNKTSSSYVWTRIVRSLRKNWSEQQALLLNFHERELQSLEFNLCPKSEFQTPFTNFLRAKYGEKQTEQAKRHFMKLFYQFGLPVQSFSLHPERIPEGKKYSTKRKLVENPKNCKQNKRSEREKNLPQWQSELHKLIQFNGLRVGAVVVLRALPDETQFWEQDRQLVAGVLEQFALSVIIKDNLASNKKWRDLNPMKTLPPRRHLIANVQRLFDRKPPLTHCKGSINQDALQLSLRLFWLEFAHIPDQLLRIIFPVHWLDLQLTAVENQRALTFGRLQLHLEQLHKRSFVPMHVAPCWLKTQSVINQKIITKRIIAYEKSLAEI